MSATAIGHLSLLLTPRDASAALQISERHLWALTKEGKIPAIRLGRAVRYRRETLEAFAIEQENGGAE
jgi:excisionase family DNA binding protein